MNIAKTVLSIKEYVLKNKLFLLILAIVFVVHNSYLSNGFTWLDQNDIIEGKAILPITELYKAFIIPFGETSFYRPLVTILNSVDHFFYGDRASGYHVTNLLLHIGVVILVPSFLSLFFKLSKAQLLVSALFVGIHPASILIVGSSTQRQEPLFLIFTMLTLIAYHKAHAGRKIWYLFSSLFFLLALLSKETAVVVIPVLIIFWEMIQAQREDWESNAKLWLTELVTLTVYIFMRIRAVPKLWGTEAIHQTIIDYILTRFGLLSKWLTLLVSPFAPPFSDAISLKPGFSGVVLGILFAILALFIVIRYGLFAKTTTLIIFTLLLLAPGLNIVPVPRIGSPHYIYLPVLGVAAGVGVLYAFIQKNVYIGFVLIVWFVLAGISVFQSGFQFKDDKTLFTKEVLKDPYFYEGHYYLGNYYIKRGDLDNAERELELGLRDDSSIVAFRNTWTMSVNLAGVKLQQGKLDEAESLYNLIEEETPDSMRNYILFNKALVAYQKNDYQRVVALLADKEWDKPEQYLLLAQALDKLGRKSESEAVLQQKGLKEPIPENIP